MILSQLENKKRKMSTQKPKNQMASNSEAEIYLL